MSIVAEAVAGAALSTFFDVLFDNLSSPDLLKIFRQKNVDADLKKWKRTLLKIHAVLEDAEERQMTSRLVKIWLDELEDLVYDVDDILDEFATEALRRKLHEEERSTSKIRKFIPACCVGFNPSSIKFDVSMRSKIEGINTRLQEIVTERVGLKLNDGAGGRTITKTSRPPTSSLVEGQTYGRDEDKNAIVKLLLESDDAQLYVIPIVGMSGLGKTTLAQLVYEDDEVKRCFKLKAWVCVSDNFDIVRLTKEILSCVTRESYHDHHLDSLQRTLQEKLSGEKFLLVLDDVWCENYENWTILRKPFESGAQGVKIVVTTRNYDVSSKMGTTLAYELKGLSHDACLRVFTHHALEATDFSEYPELENFGKEIVVRCKGAPLAAKALGGLLRNKHDPQEWEDVLNSKIWDISEEKSNIFSVLKFSYNYLPSRLKRCFAYCSLFPKGNKFKEKDLVLLWLAEGLVQKTKGKKPMEDLGGDYFRDLLKRSFFQQSSNNESLFVMHDLMHDLAQWAAGDLYCRLEDQLNGSKQFEISSKVRHFSYITSSDDCIKKFDDFPKDMHLRTFLLLPLNCTESLRYFDAKYCLLPQLRCIRVLSLSGYEISKLPSSIGDLKHLRYLNLSYTKIKSLPKSTSSLYNLQTLILEGCSYLTKLPKKIENLVNLRHLNITGASSIREMSAGIAKLKSLQTLCISHLENKLGANDARKVNLEDNKNLDTLVMKWDDDLQDAGVAANILDMSRPHGTIKTLSIEGYVGSKFPTWLGDPSFSNMVDLRIERCGKCTALPAFGQLPSLKHLIIKRMDGVQSIGLEFYGEHCNHPFQSLVKLCFEDMREWKDWSPCNQDFPCLHELSISKCPKLEGKLPHHLPEKLSIYACEQLVVSIPDHSVLQELKIMECKKVEHYESAKIEKLIIGNCEEYQDGLMSLVTLEIFIRSCQSLVNIKLKSTLRTLTIKDCSALESLQFVMDEGGASSTSSSLMNEENCSCVGNNNVSLLEHLEIANCPSLKCVSSILDIAAMLKQLLIKKCPNLTSLSSRDTLSTTLKVPQVDVINIERCDSLISLGDLAPTNLRKLDIKVCPKLEALPNNMHNLNFLQHLDIFHCPSIVSFPKEGFPTNLREIWLTGANLCKQIFELGLHRLTSLTLLNINGGIMDSFPEEEDGKTMLILPTSLTTLCFYKFPNLLFLSWKFSQNHSALEQIIIGWCPKLASLSEQCFPPSLQKLKILKCPMLAQHCKKGKGIMWSKIANIPSVEIDYVEQQKIFAKQSGLPSRLHIKLRNNDQWRYAHNGRMAF